MLWILFLAQIQVGFTTKCLPRCCPEGQILDNSGTKCLRDPSRPAQGDPCQRRDSFLPDCEEKKPIIEAIGDADVKHVAVLQGLSMYSLGIHGEQLRSYYEDKNKSGNGTDVIKSSHLIPSSFCLDPDNEKILVCPRVGLEKGAMVYKCCPFGKQLKYPLFSGKNIY